MNDRRRMKRTECMMEQLIHMAAKNSEALSAVFARPDGMKERQDRMENRLNQMDNLEDRLIQLDKCMVCMENQPKKTIE